MNEINNILSNRSPLFWLTLFWKFANIYVNITYHLLKINATAGRRKPYMTNKEILNSIISKIKSEIKRQHLSQEELANICTQKIKEKDPKAKGISQSSISNILNKPSSATLSNLLKVCDGLDLSLFAIFRSINNSLSSDNTNLIYDISNPAFKGYSSESKMYIYFLSTESNYTDELLYAELELGDFYHTNECIVRLQINTRQHSNPNTAPDYKKYEGNMMIYHNVSIFMHLVSCDTGDVWSLIFNHSDLYKKDLACSLGCAVTLASGKGHRHPTIHFACLSSQKLNSNQETIVKNQLRLHNEFIFISAKDLSAFLKNETVDEAFKNKIKSAIREKSYSYSEWYDLDSYTISIKTLEASSPLDTKRTSEAISKLLRYSSNPSSYTIAPDEDNKLYHLLND